MTTKYSKEDLKLIKLLNQLQVFLELSLISDGFYSSKYSDTATNLALELTDTFIERFGSVEDGYKYIDSLNIPKE